MGWVVVTPDGSGGWPLTDVEGPWMGGVFSHAAQVSPVRFSTLTQDFSHISNHKIHTALISFLSTCIKC